ncbi:helix-turn-helix domain-containing protein [Nocardia sp. NPDC055321]
MTTATLGARVRLSRLTGDLGIAELSALGGWPEDWLRAVEQDRITPDRYAVLDRLANLLRVDAAWLLGQPYQAGEYGRSEEHRAVPALRAALRGTSLILAGYPAIRAPSHAPDPQALRVEIENVVRRRQAARLPEVMLVLPALVEKVNGCLLDAADTGEIAGAYRLLVKLSQVARMALNKLGYHDLAWTVVDNAAIAAGRSGDAVLPACAAWERCGVLLHTGSAAQVIEVAAAAMDDIACRPGTPEPQTLSLYGALALRCAVAAARRDDSRSAWRYLSEAENTADRIGADRNDFQTVFGHGNVSIHATEIAVELELPECALRYHARVDARSVPSRERRTRHGIDVARAHAQLGDDVTATRVLRAAANLAPHYVYGHPLARGLVTNLLRRARPGAVDAGLRDLGPAMGLGG